MNVFRSLFSINVKKSKKNAENLRNSLLAKDYENAVKLERQLDDIGYLDEDNSSLLLLASNNGYTDICKNLIDKGAILDSQNDLGNTSLICASSGGYTELVMLLLQKGADVNLRSTDGWTALMYASKNGYVDIVHLLLTFNAKINEQENSGNSALMLACQTKQNEIVKILLDSGAEINLRDTDGLTALMYAIVVDNVEAVKQLLNNGAEAEINIPDNKNNLPMHLAIHLGNTDIVRLLLNNGASLILNDGDTTLILASKMGHLGIVKLILSDKRINVNWHGQIGRTAIMHAAEHSHGEIIKQLLKNGADPTLKDIYGNTAYTLAINTNIKNLLTSFLKK